MNARRSADVADRLRWGLIPLAVLIGLTAYVASDDILVSFVLSVALGLTALVAAWLLLRGSPAGSALAGVSAAVLIVAQVVDMSSITLGWIRVTYVAIGAVTLSFAAAELLASQWGQRHRAAGERIAP